MSDKYFIYCRKSQESEDRQILSLDGQKQAMEELKKKFGLKVVGTLVESKTAKKPGREVFSEMLNRIEKGEAQGILCWKLDRLARNPVDEGRIKWLLQSGVIKNIKTSDRDYYPDDNALITSVEFGMANQFSRDLGKNAKRGMKQKVDMGQPPRVAPTGYKNNILAHTIEPDPIRSPYVVKAFEMYDSGQYSLIQIVVKLNESGFSTRNGRKLQKSTLARILRDPIYYGYFYYKGELYKGAYEPLISKDLWSRVQERLNGKITYLSRKTKLVFTYRGFLFCGECGMSITADRHKGHVYYRCTKSKGSGSCSQPYTREEDLEPQLFDIFKSIELKQEDINCIHDKLIELYEKDRVFQKQTEKQLRIELSKLEEQKKQLYHKMLLTDLDDEAQKMAQELKAEIENKINFIQSKISNLSDSTYSWLEQSSNLLKLAKQATELFKKADIDQKRRLLEFVASNRTLKDRQVCYEYNKPFDLAAKIVSKKTKRPDLHQTVLSGSLS